MRLRFSVVEGPLAGRTFEFAEHASFVVGRDVANGLSISGDERVSRNHCVFEVAPPRAHVRDLGSRNGTFVNERQVAEAELSPGDRIRVGRTVLQLQLVGEAPPAPRALLVCARCGEDTPRRDAFLDRSGEDATQLAAYICRPCREKVARTPEVFPGHKVLRKLGEGGMGTVYLAMTLRTQELVAVKTLRPEVAQDPVSVNMFLREAQTGAQVDHPHAVRFFSSGYAHGLFYFVMEYVEGPDLNVFLRDLGRPMTWLEAAPIVGHLLSVLEFAHGRGLVHRDIKPSNILLARTPPDAEAKLTDFGLMKRFVSTGGSFITRTGDSVGTPAYMPPEQVTDAKRVGPPADLYALAATFFTMLTRETPIEMRPGQNHLLAVLEAPPRSLRALAPGAPPGLDAVIARCLEKDPARRYAGARELRAALNAAVKGS